MKTETRRPGSRLTQLRTVGLALALCGAAALGIGPAAAGPVEQRVKAGGTLPAGGLTVWLRAGDHLRTQAFELTAADSGTAEAPVVWRAVEGAHARLLGGRKLTGFKPVTDAATARTLLREAVDDLEAERLRQFA